MEVRRPAICTLGAGNALVSSLALDQRPRVFGRVRTISRIRVTINSDVGLARAIAYVKASLAVSASGISNVGVAWRALWPLWPGCTSHPSRAFRASSPSRTLDPLVTFRALQALQTSWTSIPGVTFWALRASRTLGSLRTIQPADADRVRVLVVSRVADVGRYISAPNVLAFSLFRHLIRPAPAGQLGVTRGQVVLLLIKIQRVARLDLVLCNFIIKLLDLGFDVSLQVCH